MTAKWFGAIESVVLGGLGTILVVVGAALAFPEIARLGRLHELKAREIAQATEEEIEESTQA